MSLLVAKSLDPALKSWGSWSRSAGRVEFKERPHAKAVAYLSSEGRVAAGGGETNGRGPSHGSKAGRTSQVELDLGSCQISN